MHKASDDWWTPCPVFTHLLTGHYVETPHYGTWRERGTDDWLLVCTLGGRGQFRSPGGGDMVAAPGDLALLRPGTPHDYGTAPGADGWELLWTHFHPRPEWYDWLAWPQHAPGLMRLDLHEPVMRRNIVACLWKAHRLATGGQRRREALAMNALEEMLLWCNTQHGPARTDPRVQQTIDYLCSRLAEPITLDGLAQVSGLSASHLSRLFHESVGLTPLQFLDRRRLERAQRLLAHTTKPVGAVAAEVGHEPLYFSHWFKRHTGRSPRDWRGRTTGAA